MPVNFPYSKAYSVPFRALWLQSNDVIEIRITLSGPSQPAQVLISPLVAVVQEMHNRLLGVALQDSKTLGLGRWLRHHWEEVSHTPGEPVPSGTVLYDEGGAFAYFSIWPNLSEADVREVQRRKSEVHVDDAGELMRIRFPVTVRRRQDALAAAAGYLATR